MRIPVIRHLLLSIFVGALVISSAARSSEPIKIGTTQSLTGHYSEFGIEQLRGLQMWAADVNARGELLGRDVEVVYYDDGSKKVNSVAGYNKLITKDKVDVLVGPYSSSLTLAASEVAEKFNIPMVSAAASSEKIWDRGLKNILGTDTPAGDYLDGLRVAADAGVKTVALAYARTEFGQELADSSKKAIESNGLKLVMFEGYPPEQLDFTKMAKRLGELNADLVFGISYMDDSIAMTRALKNAGVKPKMLGFTVGPGVREFRDKLGADAEGVVGIVQWLRGSRQPGAQDFAYRFEQRYGYYPGVYAVIGYSAGQIIEAAVRLAGTTDHDAVRNQLSTMYFRALIGSYSVDATGRQKGRRNYVLQWQNNDRRVVGPADIAESPLIYPLQ
jgi:branched-chain amino acid transport system substrate-binding protein